jgi:hypothetical protein
MFPLLFQRNGPGANHTAGSYVFVEEPSELAPQAPAAGRLTCAPAGAGADAPAAKGQQDVVALYFKGQPPQGAAKEAWEATLKSCGADKDLTCELMRARPPAGPPAVQPAKALATEPVTAEARRMRSPPVGGSSGRERPPGGDVAAARSPAAAAAGSAMLPWSRQDSLEPKEGADLAQSTRAGGGDGDGDGNGSGDGDGSDAAAHAGSTAGAGTAAAPGRTVAAGAGGVNGGPMSSPSPRQVHFDPRLPSPQLRIGKGRG